MDSPHQLLADEADVYVSIPFWLLGAPQPVLPSVRARVLENVKDAPNKVPWSRQHKFEWSSELMTFGQDLSRNDGDGSRHPRNTQRSKGTFLVERVIHIDRSEDLTNVFGAARLHELREYNVTVELKRKWIYYFDYEVGTIDLLFRVSSLKNRPHSVGLLDSST